METTPKIDWTYPEEGPHPEPRVQAAEIAVFLLIILPSLAVSFFAIKQGQVSFSLTAAATILRDAGLVALVAYFLWRNKEGFASIGWKARKLGREIVIGALLFVPMFFFTGWLELALRGLGFKMPATPRPSYLIVEGTGEIVLAFILVCVVALAEETIFRGYLLLRFEGVGVRPSAAVLLSAAIFALGHGYEGSAGVATILVMGLIFAIVYLWRRSLVASITMHFLQDFLGLVLLPILKIGPK